MLASTIQQVLGRLLVRRGHCGGLDQLLVRRGHRGGQRHWEGGWEGGEGSTCLKLLDVVAQLGRGLGEDVQLGDGEVEEEEEEGHEEVEKEEEEEDISSYLSIYLA